MNNTIRQGFTNGWSNIQYDQVLSAGVMGAMTSYAGGQLGKTIGKPLDKLIDIQSPLLKQTIVNSVSGSAVGSAIGGAVALNNGANFWEGAWNGAKMGMVTGAISGIGAAAQYSVDHQVNMLTGNANPRETFNYKDGPMRHQQERGRMVPEQILDEVIKNPLAVTSDPAGTSNADMYYSQINKNGKIYNIEVLYNKSTNTIYHFQYSRDPMGPLFAIPKK